MQNYQLKAAIAGKGSGVWADPSNFNKAVHEKGTSR